MACSTEWRDGLSPLIAYVCGKKLPPNKCSQSHLVVLRGTAKLDTDLLAIDPTYGCKRDIHRTGLVRKKQAELHVITDM
ncbi:MAG TPA: hypothetical protein VKB81_03770 [Nitrospira sp.]|nr:hypothetical protein [Nitrospira sp.]